MQRSKETTFKIHAGDFGKGIGVLHVNNIFSLPVKGYVVSTRLISKVEIATEASVVTPNPANGGHLKTGQ
jgi:hypothetical protein